MKFNSAHARSWVIVWLAAIILLMAVVFSGCGAGNPFPTGSFERGALFKEQEKYPEAVSSLEAFVRHNPTDTLAAEAQFLKGESYMDMEEYPLAIVEFQILAKDYPTSPRVEDAMFQQGKAYFLQVGRVERDITGAHEARLHFLKFSQLYPQSEHMDEVITTMQDISDLMTLKRLEQAQVFHQLHKPNAVVMILGEVLKNEANSRLLDRVYWERGQAAEIVLKLDLAVEMYETLVRDYPESEYRDDAADALRELNKYFDEEDE